MEATIIIQVLTALILLVTVIFIGRQVSEGKRGAYAQSFAVIYELLQNERTLAARGHVLTTLKSKERSDWDDTDIAQAEQVCRTYDAAAIMCRVGMLPPEILADSWGDSIRRSWKVLEVLVLEYRDQRSSPEFWDDFEWIADVAKQLHKTNDVAAVVERDRVRSLADSWFDKLALPGRPRR